MPMKSYKKLCTEFYDLDKPSAPEDALSFIKKYLAPIDGPVLEPMSGSGRFLIPLFQRGVKIEGLDPSQDMLKACRELCKRENIKPVLYEGCLESMSLSRSYELIFILSGSFGLITDQHWVTKSMERLFEHLTPQGTLIIEIETPNGKESGLQDWSIRSVNRPDGAQITCRSQGNYSPENRVDNVYCEYRLIQNGKIVGVEFEELSIRYFELKEFSDLLNNAGFVRIESFRPYGNINSTEEDERAVFICRKA